MENKKVWVQFFLETSSQVSVCFKKEVGWHTAFIIHPRLPWTGPTYYKWINDFWLLFWGSEILDKNKKRVADLEIRT